MSENERLAVLEQRVKELEAHEERQRNWRMRYIGWLVSPSVGLFIAGLTLWGQVGHLEYIVEEVKSKIEKIGSELGNIHDKIDRGDTHNHDN